MDETVNGIMLVFNLSLFDKDGNDILDLNSDLHMQLIVDRHTEFKQMELILTGLSRFKSSKNDS